MKAKEKVSLPDGIYTCTVKGWNCMIIKKARPVTIPLNQGIRGTAQMLAVIKDGHLEVFESPMPLKPKS